MRFALVLLTFFAITVSTSFAQLAPKPQETVVPLMQDTTTKAPLKMDFSIPLTGISDPGILFSHFDKKPLLIFYFSPKCPHCQKHFPNIQGIMTEYESAGLTGIAIGLGGGIKKNDIRLFIDQFHAVIPVFQDTDSRFSAVYGTGYIPVVYLVNADGTIYRYETLNEAQINHLRATLNKTIAK